MKRRFLFLIGVCLVIESLFFGCVTSKSDSNDTWVFLPLTASAKQYSFFVAGHTYGIPSVADHGIHPPFKALFPQINSSNLDFGVFTGDIVTSGTLSKWDEIDTDLAELTPQVHFVVGNHDMTNRDLFVSRYGPTYYSFEYRGDLFIMLDGELDPCNISNEQMTFLQDALSASEAQNIFVFVHKLIWVTEGTPYYALASKLNSVEGYNFHANFWSDVEPLFRATGAQVYVVAGDVGVTWAMPLFYETYENIHLVASGMGGSEEENYVIFDVYANDVEIRVQRLDGQALTLGSIEAYNLAHYSGAQ